MFRSWKNRYVELKNNLLLLYAADDGKVKGGAKGDANQSKGAEGRVLEARHLLSGATVTHTCPPAVLLLLCFCTLLSTHY
jgi:hypothetical protein